MHKAHCNTTHDIIHHSAITPNTKLEKPKDETTNKSCGPIYAWHRPRWRDKFPGLSATICEDYLTVCEQFGRRESIRLCNLTKENPSNTLVCWHATLKTETHIYWFSKTRQAICYGAEAHILTGSIFRSDYSQDGRGCTIYLPARILGTIVTFGSKKIKKISDVLWKFGSTFIQTRRPYRSWVEPAIDNIFCIYFWNF